MPPNGQCIPKMLTKRVFNGITEDETGVRRGDPFFSGEPTRALPRSEVSLRFNRNFLMDHRFHGALGLLCFGFWVSRWFTRWPARRGPTGGAKLYEWIFKIRPVVVSDLFIGLFGWFPQTFFQYSIFSMEKHSRRDGPGFLPGMF